MAATGFQNPIFEDDSNVTFTAHNAITKGTFVEISGNMTVQTAVSLSTKVVGVSKETVADGDLVTVDCRGEIWKMKAKGAVSAGDDLVAASDGSGGVSTVAAVDNTSAATVATGVSGTRAIVALALEAIADGASGRVMVL